MIVFVWTEVKICVYYRLRLQSSSCGRSLKQTFPKSVHRRLKRQSEAMFHVVHTTYNETGLTIMLNSVFLWKIQSPGFVRSEPNNLKAWPNACNISTQHLATFLGTTCCIRLTTLLRYVATCWMMLDQIWKRSNFLCNILDVVWCCTSHYIIELDHTR